MEGNRLIKTIRVRNLLSYGEKTEATPLEPLNVLIGRNASGKSNLIEAISLLKSTPKNIDDPIRGGGGIGEWLWKGGNGKAEADLKYVAQRKARANRSKERTIIRESNPKYATKRRARLSSPEAEIEAVVYYREGLQALRHQMSFTAVNQRIEVTQEFIGSESSQTDDSSESFFYRYQNGNRQVRTRQQKTQKAGTTLGRPWQSLSTDDFSQEQSILSQLKDPFHYPEITYLGSKFGEIRLFREEYFGPFALARDPVDAAQPNDFLAEDGGNLAMVVDYLRYKISPMREILERLKEFYPEVEDIITKTEGGTVQLFLLEKGLSRPVPALRLSDGTLRYLCLLVVLCHPTPPPLMCIEEPELGLHPDILPTIAELLQEASKRTQLIVTTHSDALVSALSDTPESILVCERDNDGTHLRRLEHEPLKEWLEKYPLGELWRMGEIGGNRW